MHIVCSADCGIAIKFVGLAFRYKRPIAAANECAPRAYEVEINWHWESAGTLRYTVHGIIDKEGSSDPTMRWVPWYLAEVPCGGGFYWRWPEVLMTLPRLPHLNYYRPFSPSTNCLRLSFHMAFITIKHSPRFPEGVCHSFATLSSSGFIFLPLKSFPLQLRVFLVFASLHAWPFFIDLSGRWNRNRWTEAIDDAPIVSTLSLKTQLYLLHFFVSFFHRNIMVSIVFLFVCNTCAVFIIFAA